MQRIVLTGAIIHDCKKISRKTAGMIFIRSIFIACTLTAIPAHSGEWHALSHGEDTNFIYETSLIEESGVFSKEYTAWLKIKRLKNEISCGTKPQDYELQEGGQGLVGALSQDLVNYGYCMQRAMKAPMVEVHKVSLECKNKNISHSAYESTNSQGEWVAPTYRIGSHPGSLGYAVMSLYCGS
ncbi:hypothetical protein ACUTAF_15350 [Pseudomonas sp. SP16.1]|uniref:hypothetical protein n=1 Tax=Pseudomonas sp. SP16.1 TaxID=3458854 RepID=UPI004046070F